jgi:hypothetical protein
MVNKVTVLSILAVAAIAGVAAIVSSQNELFTYAPDYATFPDGIQERFIPFGTYTDGMGSTEYCRVSSNLIGVVASTFDGSLERLFVPQENYIRTNHWSFFERVILTPTYRFNTFEDNGEFLHSAINNSMRILDRINKSNFILCVSNENSIFRYSPIETGLIETTLAHEEVAAPISYHEGRARDYSGRRLDDLVTENGASIDPPIPTSWTTALPFQAADSNAWATVWPTYSALTNDIHFFPSSTNAEPRYFRWHLSSDQTPQGQSAWFNPDHLRYVWGSDVLGDLTGDGSAALEAMLNLIPLPYTMEDVLSYDTGWKYEVPPELTNDYWTVGSKQLDRSYISGDWDDLAHSDGADWSWVKDDEHYQIQWIPPATWAYFWWNDYDSFEYHVSGSPGDKIIDFGNGIIATKTELYAGTDDYVHWTNMTRRLDWQRLGIICQLERQMEQTYLPRQEEDQLPFVATEAHRSFVYEGEKTDIPLTHYLDQGTYDWHIETTNFTANGVSWSLATQNVDFVTNKLEMCYPTARTGPCLQFGGIKAYFPTNIPVYTAKSEYTDILLSAINSAAATNGFKNGYIQLLLSGNLYIISAAYQDGHTYGYNVYIDWHGLGGDFYPESGDDEYFYPEVQYQTTFFVPGLDTSDVFIRLEMETDRLATSLFTDSIVNNATPSDLDPVDRETIVTNFVPYPQVPTWTDGWAAWQDRPTLEVMIDAVGASILDELNPYDIAPLRWDDIRDEGTDVARRAFRMSPFNVPQENKYNSDNNRLKMLLELDREVKSRFETLAGMPVQRAAEVLSNFKAGEEASIKHDLENIPLKVGFSLMPYYGFDYMLWLEAGGIARLDENGEASNLSDIYIQFAYALPDDPDIHYVFVPEEDDAYSFVSWQSGVDHHSISNLPYVEPVRVDGHQDQMIKTLWKFKNLRDPTL